LKDSKLTSSQQFSKSPSLTLQTTHLIFQVSSLRSQPVESLPSRASESNDKVVRLEWWNSGIMGSGLRLDSVP
jgi:hypothetical protein